MTRSTLFHDYGSCPICNYHKQLKAASKCVELLRKAVYPRDRKPTDKEAALALAEYDEVIRKSRE